MMKAFSNNIIFLDTEFSSLNPYKGEILSIGLVKLNGGELYMELEYNGEIDEWVKENVTPFLMEEKVNREEAVRRIKKFVGDKKPYMLAYVNQFDAIYLYKLFKIENNPFHWIPIDFASMLFAFRINPERYNWEDKDNFYQEIGINHNKYRKHHALDDAKLLRQVYLKFVDANKGVVKIFKK